MRTPATTVKKSAFVLGAGLAALALAATAVAPGAYAASEGDVEVVNTETVQVYVNPDGSIESQRVYEQLTLTGTGATEVANPIEEEGLRNLDGFGTSDVEDGVQSFEVDVDGVERLRSVSDYTGELPLEVSVEYRLDGELVEPGDVVGSDGELEVLYTARNITAQSQEVSFPDGRGGTTTETVDVPIPMVGSLTTVVPPSFTEVTSEQANMAGDGKGGTKLSFTMTLFPPIGSDTARFGYTAKISDGVVPSSSVSALPVNPLQSPSFKTAGESYQGGSETGVKLAEGASEIDMNLLKLRDGAATLLGGLIQLSDGADQLSAGLAGEAAPGARTLADGAGDLDEGLGKIDDGAGKLADGAGDLDEGLGKIDDGAGKLADGAGRADEGAGKLAKGARKLSGGLGDLDTGVGDLDDGAGQLAAGQRALAAGLKKLYVAADNLPASVREQLAANAEYQRLLGTLGAIVSGIGNEASMGRDTLMGGLFQVRSGLRYPGTTDCQVAFGGGTPSQCGVADAAQFMAGLLPAKKQELSCASLILADLTGGADAPGACFPSGSRPPLADETSPVNVAVLTSLSQKLESGAADIDKLRAGLEDIYTGVDNQIVPGINGLRKALYNANCNPAQTDKTAADYCGVAQALQLVQAGVPTLVDQVTAGVRAQLVTALATPTAGCDPEATLRCAAAALATGGKKLDKGVDKLVAGVGLLNSGGELLSNGAGELSTGLGELSEGAGTLADGTGEASGGADQLSDGAGKLADGTGTASDGSGKLADGAGKLADGLGDAADGSVRLADGLAQAREGAPALVDGAGRLSKEGMSKLIGAGEDTAQDYGKLYATLEAGAERADAERMAYGAPADAQGMTAYTYELLGDDGETRRNTKRGLAALGLLGLGGGAFFLRRRLI